MIPLIKPDLSFDEVSADIQAILESGRLTTGPYVQKFEKLFAEYIGVKHAVTATSATTALHMTLVARGIGPGDEVLISDFSFPASGNVVAQVGATPIFVDCRPGGFDIDFADARKKVSDKVKAIMVVHPFGQPARYDELAAFAQDNGIWVLEDAACAISSRWGDLRCGAMGGAACFSFHPRKILTTGEGGMITTNDDGLYERLAILRSHGGRPAEVGFEFVESGFNYRMSEVQAAMGLAQLRRIDEILAERRRVAALLMARLRNLNFLTVPLTASVNECSFQSFVILLDQAIDRNRVIQRMKAAGVEAMLGTYAMHAHPAFRRYGYRPGDLPQSFHAQSQSLTLPLFKGMTAEDVDRIVQTLVAAVGQ